MEVRSSTLRGTTEGRGISSVGLEHLPCTQGVKGSSPLFSTEGIGFREEVVIYDSK